MLCRPVSAAQEPPPQIPEWLPALPDRHTYVATPSYAGHDTDAKRQRLAATKAKRQVPPPPLPPNPTFQPQVRQLASRLAGLPVF